ncbi:MAG: hypothetical protein DWQ18_05035 [Crenarchaeota archaeon]|nr:MAG: hypothetical protein DWQ17_08095 [Thermoproteota archaeon]RDJ34253.1 MAG: hypothetical protein DWQ18_05035 [Thermoproteota archaeon]RDJ36634.1 MAG: hypothetical protein DWQ13_05575 [Thermoproteota archaeon]RDJ37836.1 MAG: hypothetical protein DWQ19_05260 [Thermoproteota archaeon]
MFLDDFSLTIIVIAAGVLILSGWVEQIIRGYRTKSLKDVSPYLMILIAIGALLWLIYGIEILDPYIVGTNIAAIILMIIIFGLKRRYDRKKAL